MSLGDFRPIAINLRSSATQDTGYRDRAQRLETSGSLILLSAASEYSKILVISISRQRLSLLSHAQILALQLHVQLSNTSASLVSLITLCPLQR